MNIYEWIPLMSLKCCLLAYVVSYLIVWNDHITCTVESLWTTMGSLGIYFILSNFSKQIIKNDYNQWLELPRTFRKANKTLVLLQLKCPKNILVVIIFIVMKTYYSNLWHHKTLIFPYTEFQNSSPKRYIPISVLNNNILKYFQWSIFHLLNLCV